MRKIVTAVLLAGFISLVTGGSLSYAGEVDILLQKLVEKGVLTAGEAQEIKTETQEQVKLDIAQGKNESLPKWLQTMKFKGDMRVRYQNDYKKGGNNSGGRNSIEQNRARFRLRVGAEAKVKDKAKVYFGIASGNSTDNRSTNQTFNNFFEKKSLWIDYAYADYQFLPWLKGVAGRMKNPLWEPGDLLWDTDINPEGGSLQVAQKLTPLADLFMNSAVFIIDENTAASDPWMFVLQPGVNFKFDEAGNTALKLAASYYNFQQLQGSIPEQSQASNNRSRGGYQYGFDAITPAVELAVREPFKQLGLDVPSLLNFPYVSIFGEYVHNLEAPFSKTGYLCGLRLGEEKVDDKGKWQVRYMYAMLGTQAWPDFLPDSDRYTGGRTGIRSHEITLSYGLGKNLSLDLDYYLSRLTTTNVVSANPDQLNTENLFQADLNWKF